MNIQTFLDNILLFLNGTLLPFLMAIAGLYFIWHTTKFFILGGSNPKEQEKAKILAQWGILAFVAIVSLWGVVRLISNGIGLNNPNAITPDYMESKGAGGTGASFPADNDAGYQLPSQYTTPE